MFILTNKMSNKKIMYNNRTGCFKICDSKNKLYKLYDCTNKMDITPFLRANEVYNYKDDGENDTFTTDGIFWTIKAIDSDGSIENIKFRVDNQCSKVCEDCAMIKTITK
tara:strand:- start:122 stop:448 length:327 start_codon:yes stop_codon:yes gene_type:complete